MNNKCKIKNCKNPLKIKKHGLCKTHANRLYAGLSVDYPIVHKSKPRVFNAYNGENNNETV